MEELLHLIQTDPELWEIVEQLKSQDQEPEDFFLNVAAMLAVEFEELRRTDLNDKLAALFGGLPEPAFKMVGTNEEADQKAETDFEESNQRSQEDSR